MRGDFAGNESDVDQHFEPIALALQQIEEA
jgi:hypothetical protein